MSSGIRTGMAGTLGGSEMWEMVLGLGIGLWVAGFLILVNLLGVVLYREARYGGVPKLLGKDEWGALYRIKRFDRTEWGVLEVEDRSPTGWFGRGKMYRLRVHPNCKTPKAAVAWTFGKKEGEYGPEVET